MRKNKLFFSCISLCLIASACSSEDELINDSPSYVDDIVVNFEPTQLSEEGSTRALPKDNGSSFSYLCYAGDALGIYSYKDNTQQGYQMSFAISGNGVKDFKFNGGGWKMLTDFNYVAYTPFVYDNKDAKAIPLSFLGQEQDGDASTDHLANYCFMSSGESHANSANELSLSMQFKANLSRMKLTLPDPITVKRVALKTSNKDFIQKTSYNLLTSTFNTPQSENKSDVVSMKVKNLTTNSSNQLVTLYMILCPTVITSGNITVYVEATNGAIYSAPYSIEEFKRGAKGIVVTLTKVSDPVVIPEEPSDGVTGTAPDFTF